MAEKKRRRLLLKLGYDGNFFKGFQIQPNVITVQGVLEQFLTHFLNEKIRVSPAGRTDAGVHAWGQVVHFDCFNPIPCSKLFMALKKKFTRDIIIRHLWDVPTGFHARYDSSGKTYIYIIHPIKKGRIVTPFQKGYEWQIEEYFNWNAVEILLSRMQGEHEFRAFCKLETITSNNRNTSQDPIKIKTRRTLQKIKRLKRDNRHYFIVMAKGFLRYQVRLIIKAIYLVGTGQCSIRRIIKLFEEPERAFLGEPSPAEGLYLWKVHYQPHPLLQDK
ncbi:tRNA pseudouridine(38-40) synthase TruA [Candidatus Riflebacteria bacterium]